MGLDKKYFDYCSKIGILKEDHDKQYALDSIKAKVAAVYDADPAFIQRVQNLTLNSYEVSVRSCVVYRYEADIEYVVGGNIRDTKVADFGYRHISDSLHITEFNDGATYKTLNSSYDIPYDVYHSENLFTYDQMKNALTDKLAEYLPSNYSSYRTKNWNVEAYIVPVLVVILDHGNESYQLYYNLHNGYYHWEWPIDPVIIKKGKQTKNLASFIRIASIVLSIISVLLAFSMMGNSDSYSAMKVLVPVISTIVSITVNKKAKEKNKSYQDIFSKNKNKNIYSCVVPEFVLLGLAFVAFIFALVA